MAIGIRALADTTPQKRVALLKAGGPEAVYGKTIDFVGIAFLERGHRAAQAVGRVAFRDGRAQGSGFMVSDRLFLTNNHVLSAEVDAAQFCIEFDYELDPRDRPRGPTRFAFDPRRLFITDPVKGLDYTLIAVGDSISGSRPLAEFGWCGLSGASDKHALGEVANVVQHPDGRYKEVVLRENRLVSRLDFVLHYMADTEPGSSGAPVFNNEWKVIALHHWGGPWREQVNERGRPLNREVNEGIRISAVVNDLRTKLQTLPADRRALVQQVIAIGENAMAPAPRAAQSTFEEGPMARLDPDGGVTWRVPLEVSVRLPALNGAAKALPPAAAPALGDPAVTGLAEARIRPSNDYSDRSGYKPRFIEGFVVELPRLTGQQERDAAKNREAGAGDNPFELQYHHFSIVMNRKRRLAFFTACNINGDNAKHVNRDTGDVTPLQADDPRLESLVATAEAAEASESWYDDERLDPEDYSGKDVYEGQLVRGFPNPRSMGRTLRMFQRGHLVRRMDPAWGTNNQAKLADADTFHWTNCSPQVGFFNMGRAHPNTPNSGGGKLWRAMENYVLRNAVAEDARVCSFTGPIFTEQDRVFRDIKVPGRFWKVVVWAEDGALRSVAMIADQRPVIRVWPEALSEASEAFGDASELDKVEDFLTTVAEIERLTKLKFGDDVRAADVRAGERLVRVTQADEIPLRRRTRRRGASSSRRRRRRT